MILVKDESWCGETAESSNSPTVLTDRPEEERTVRTVGLFDDSAAPNFTQITNHKAQNTRSLASHLSSRSQDTHRPHNFPNGQLRRILPSNLEKLQAAGALCTADTTHNKGHGYYKLGEKRVPAHLRIFVPLYNRLCLQYYRTAL